MIACGTSTEVPPNDETAARQYSDNDYVIASSLTHTFDLFGNYFQWSVNGYPPGQPLYLGISDAGFASAFSARVYGAAPTGTDGGGYTIATPPLPVMDPSSPPTVSYSFWGHVTASLPQGAIGIGDLALYLPIQPAVGDLYSITYVVHRSVTDTNSANNIGDYLGAIRSITLIEGANAPLTLPNGATQLTLDNTMRMEWSAATNANNITLNAGGTQSGVRPTAFEASLVLGNAIAGYFASDVLPTSTPDPSVFLSRNFRFSGAGGYFVGTVEGTGSPPQFQ